MSPVAGGSVMVHDVIVVGAGPAGSSAAAFLARRGVRTLLLDRAAFPRDKVCGDGLTPQAIYWLDRLGCVSEVLAETSACIKRCELYLDGRHLLTGGFPTEGVYPDFAVLLDRRRLDHILVRHAVGAGTQFAERCEVRRVEAAGDGVKVVADAGGRRVVHRGRIVIGADGTSSVVSRAIGNVLNQGVTALSLRTYYRDADCPGAPIKVYFDAESFPGYGWFFADDRGVANVGLGYACQDGLPIAGTLRAAFERFVDTRLGKLLRRAKRSAPVAGGAVSFHRPAAIVADRVMLVGDAANQADPLNGGGIHKAIEGAFLAAEAAALALETGDCTARTLKRYEAAWREHVEFDWRLGELLLAVACNRDLRDVFLFVLQHVGRLGAADPRFRDFCSGVFTGVISRKVCLSPLALYYALPDADAWLALLRGRHGFAEGSARLAASGLSRLSLAGRRLALAPLRNLDWGMDVATKGLRLAEMQLRPAPRAAFLSPG